VIYALCLLGATYNHASMLVAHGLFWDYGGMPKASAAFWTALTVIDPAAAVLLFLRPNAGIIATAAIIIVDVIHNLWITARYFPPLLDGLSDSSAVIEQIMFMVFVIASAPFAWKRRCMRGYDMAKVEAARLKAFWR
jgi:hypothetical protein